MKYNREIHHRRSQRLKGFDYASPGFYFVTLLTHSRDCLFGEIIRDNIRLTDSGQMIKIEWEHLSHRFKNIVLDQYVIMPNHIHGIIGIIGDSPFQTINDYSKNPERFINKTGFVQNTFGTPVNSISRMIQGFKSITTNKYIKSVRTHRWPDFEKHLWQRNFFDRIIRDREELKKIRAYIVNNPSNWESDEDNPKNITSKHPDPVP